MPSVTWQLATVMTPEPGASGTWAHWPGLSGLFHWELREKGRKSCLWNLVLICLDPPGFPLLILWCCLLQSQPKGKGLPNWPLFFFLFFGHAMEHAGS